MTKIRVLVVDDAVVVRRMVSNVISADPEFEVVGTAANGKLALVKIPQVNPDVVVLDVEMPEMNGLEALAEIRKLYPFLPVIMFSTLTRAGASATIDALTLGANDYVTKPANVGSVAEGLGCLRDQLIPKLKFWCKPRTAAAPTRSDPNSAKPVAPRPRLMAPSTPAVVDIVAIGVSTGGPNALSALLPTLPADFPTPIVIVQHMPPVFTKLLAERLSTLSKIPVAEVTAGMVLLPGHAYMAPGDFHMAVHREGAILRLGTNQQPPENSCRPAVDVLFRSVVEVFGRGTLGVILTGMGQDGLRGCEKIRDVGGAVLAQDEASSVVWGMPGYVVRAGLADEILPLREMAAAIFRRVRKGRESRTVRTA